MRPGCSIFVLWLRLIVLFLALTIGKQASAQYFNTGQEAASVRWRQISTPHVKLIFPDYYEARARQLASYLDTLHEYASASLSHYPKRIPLLLHTQTSTSNALVAWAPKRMEFYTTPPQDMYAQPWLQQLALHEYRHVVQIDKLNQGPTKVLSWIFGQQGTAAVLGLYVPPWFLEGDAVASETGLSLSGRGRVPQFEMRLRAQVLAKGPYSYDKAVMGSYRNFIPDPYELGYHIIAEARRNYGDTIWEHTLNRVAKRPYMITPFQKGIKDISGKRKIPFYEECMGGLQQRWQVQDRHTPTQRLEPLSPAAAEYTDYRQPCYLNDTMVIAMKTSIDDITRLVQINRDGKEEVIFTPGFLKRETLSCAGGKICWAETRPDLRWENRSYTVIRVFDFNTGKATTIGFKQRIFAPALSDDASVIAAVRVDSLDNYSIVIMQADHGGIIKTIDMPDHHFPMTPVWAGNNRLFAVAVSEMGKNIIDIDIATGRTETLLAWSFEEISQPCHAGPMLYFTAGYSGISNIYALQLDDEKIFSVTSSRFGAADPEVSADGSKLMFADYTPDGFRIVELPLSGSEWIPLESVANRSVKLYESLYPAETLMPDMEELPPSGASSNKYSKMTHLFNFHSWAPVDINASNYDIGPGISLMSQNLLGSSFLTAGYRYDVNEQLGKYYGQFTYAGWYPLIDLGIDHGLRRDYYSGHGGMEYKWRETNLSAGIRLPLNLSRGKYYNGISVSASASQTLKRMEPESPVEFVHPDIFSMGYGFSAYHQIKSSFRDIFPRWGQRVSFLYRHTPFQGAPGNSLGGMVANFYFPGLFRHHGLNVYAGYQLREIDYYKFSDVVAYPRGISGRQDRELLSIRSSYAFPIAYPDWSIGPIIYMKRIRGAFFYDYAVGRNPGRDNYYNTMGADLIAEVHLLRFVAPFEFGLRSIYLPEENGFGFQFIFGVDFNSFYVGDRY